MPRTILRGRGTNLFITITHQADHDEEFVDFHHDMKTMDELWRLFNDDADDEEGGKSVNSKSWEYDIFNAVSKAGQLDEDADDVLDEEFDEDQD